MHSKRRSVRALALAAGALGLTFGPSFGAAAGPQAQAGSPKDPPGGLAQPACAAPVADLGADLEAAFECAFGTPSSPRYRRLHAQARAALQRFFLHGPGAAGRDGEVDALASGPSPLAPGSQASGGWVTRRQPVPGYPGLVHVTMSGTGTGFLERFLLQMPTGTGGAPRPLLVAFHKYGTSHADVLFNTTLFEEAHARGWYVVAPLGAMQNNFGSLESQVNVLAAIDWTRTVLPIDGERIYGVGFSMGGGGCASFAARHVDAAATRFAAIVNHSGTVSLAHAWANENDAVRLHLEARFGGTPAEQPFAYQRCSTIDLDPATGAIGVGTDMARNLSEVHTWLAASDPDQYLPAQTQAFHSQVDAWHPSAVLTLAPGDEHSWSTLDEAAVCNWLGQHALQETSSGTLLADGDGGWHRFQVEQDGPGAFTPFAWSVDAGANRLALTGTRNLRRLAVDAGALGLVYGGSFRLDLANADGSGDEVLLTGVPFAPNAVYRNGQPASAAWDALAHTLLVDENAGGASQWVIVF